MTDIRLFEVGGSIRDELMGIENPPDRDFCAVSHGGWEDLLEWAHSKMDRVFQVKEEFFTIRGSLGKDVIDVVMCRKDGHSTDGRRPDLVEPGTLLDDLARRDFTMNAIAREVDENLSPVGDIIDPFDGRLAIRETLLESVGDTEERFKEDGLRLLRAARFCVTKGVSPSEDISLCLEDEQWWKFMSKTVSEDRVRAELTKMCKHDTAETLTFLSMNCSSSAVRILFQDNIWLKPTTEKR